MGLLLFATTAVFLVLSIGFIEFEEHETRQKEQQSAAFHTKRHVVKQRK